MKQFFDTAEFDRLSAAVFGAAFTQHYGRSNLQWAYDQAEKAQRAFEAEYTRRHSPKPKMDGVW